MQAPDYSDIFGREDLSDVNVLIYEEEGANNDSSASPQQAGKRPHRAEEVLPCHRVVLRALSPYFKTKVVSDVAELKIDKWSRHQPAADIAAGRPSKAARTMADQDAAAASADQQEPSKPQIELPVPSGQLPVGRLLLKSMYEAHPDLSCVSQTQLAQLIVLADRYEVPKVVAAAAAAIRGVQTCGLEWETVLTVCRILAACAGNEAYEELQAAAGAKLQEELGDLDDAWLDPDRQQHLMQLPLSLLQQLLSDPQTRVASEDTVLYTLERWCAWQQQHVPPALRLTDEQLLGLLGMVRMRHCSRVYVAGIFAVGTVQRVLQQAELVQAVAIAGSTASAASAWPVQQTFPEWAGHNRPGASDTGRFYTVRFDVEQLERMYEDMVAGAASAADGVFRASLYSPEAVYRGGPLCVAVFCESKPGPTPTICLGFGLKLVGLSA